MPLDLKLDVLSHPTWVRETDDWRTTESDACEVIEEVLFCGLLKRRLFYDLIFSQVFTLHTHNRVTDQNFLGELVTRRLTLRGTRYVLCCRDESCCVGKPSTVLYPGFAYIAGVFLGTVLHSNISTTLAATSTNMMVIPTWDTVAAYNRTSSPLKQNLAKASTGNLGLKLRSKNDVTRPSCPQTLSELCCAN